MDINAGENPEVRRTRTKAVLALICVIAVAALDEIWIWGLLFAVWSANGMLTGRAYLVEELSSETFPLLCWCINIVWFAIGCLMIAEAFVTA